MRSGHSRNGTVDYAKECQYCFDSIDEQCGYCDSPVGRNDNFCTHCGAPTGRHTEVYERHGKTADEYQGDIDQRESDVIDVVSMISPFTGMLLKLCRNGKSSKR